MAMDNASQSAGIPASTNAPLINLFPSLFPKFATRDSFTWLYTTAAVLASLLVLEQTVYRYKKRHLPGATWTIPLIGKFADSMKPTMEGYMKQWNSGALSAISVFNMCVHSPLPVKFLISYQLYRYGFFNRILPQNPQLPRLC